MPPVFLFCKSNFPAKIYVSKAYYILFSKKKHAYTVVYQEKQRLYFWNV